MSVILEESVVLVGPVSADPSTTNATLPPIALSTRWFCRHPTPENHGALRYTERLATRRISRRGPAEADRVRVPLKKGRGLGARAAPQHQDPSVSPPCSSVTPWFPSPHLPTALSRSRRRRPPGTVCARATSLNHRALRYTERFATRSASLHGGFHGGVSASPCATGQGTSKARFKGTTHSATPMRPP